MIQALTPDKDRPFVSDIQELRRRAIEHMEMCVVSRDRETVIRILNEVLAAKRQFFMATGIAKAVAQEFLAHANEEQVHADISVERITRSHAQYVEDTSLMDMVREDLIAERIAYNEIIRYLGNDDLTTRIAMEQIMAKEEEHADDMKPDTLSADERFAAHS